MANTTDNKPKRTPADDHRAAVDTQVDAVLFDMDGVLCDSEPLICEAACAMFRERHGLTVKPEDFVPFVGMGENRYLGGVAERYGCTLDLEHDKARTYAIYLERIRGRLQPLPGLHDFIADCRARNLKLAVASSADRIKLEGNLRELGLDRGVFEVCVDGTEVARRKPEPDLFLLAARRLGVAPARCLVVEDAPSGIQAALAAGARALGILSSFSENRLREAGAYAVARNLADAREKLPLLLS